MCRRLFHGIGPLPSEAAFHGIENGSTAANTTAMFVGVSFVWRLTFFVLMPRTSICRIMCKSVRSTARPQDYAPPPSTNSIVNAYELGHWSDIPDTIVVTGAPADTKRA